MADLFLALRPSKGPPNGCTKQGIFICYTTVVNVVYINTDLTHFFCARQLHCIVELQVIHIII